MARWNRGSKKWRQTQRRRHNEAKDGPRRWWQDEDYVWEPLHVKEGRNRARWKRAEQKRYKESRRYTKTGYQWLNDFGVSRSASKHRFHRRHEIKPYTRPTKGSRG